MVSIIDSSTVGLLSLALDATGMRQQAIAQNIANANTPGYQRLAVSFESRMGELKTAVSQGKTPSLASLADFRPAFELAGAPGDAVPLDIEVAALSENTLHQQALLKVLNKHFALLGAAINEGKR
ncbi:flagellar basal body protein [Oxalobacteraceae bacterium]|nr:flagellar basal body protein [Oxalobacteraceae bacterium]